MVQNVVNLSNIIIIDIEYQPLKRGGHSAEKVGNCLYMWGGYQPDIPIIHNNEEKKAMLSIIEVYHLCTGSWEQKPTIGNPPLAVRDYASAVIGNEIYYFGGYCNHPYCYHNSLNSLDVSTLKWQEICPTTPRDDTCRPMMKGYCGMVALLLDREDYLAVVGGRGLPNMKDSDHMMDLHSTKEIHYYKLSG